MSEIALSPSERRLHPESEQLFRILDTSTAAIGGVLVEEDFRLDVHDVGACDPATLRGLVRLAERLAWAGAPDRLRLSGHDARSAMGARLAALGHPSPEPVRFAERIGTGRVPDGPAPERGPAGHGSPEAELLATVFDAGAGAVDRIAHAVESIRRAFFRCDYEVMLLAALTGAELCAPGLRVDGADIDTALTAAGIRSRFADAVEFEVGLLRGSVDVRAFFTKTVGMVHSFRGLHAEALDRFLAIAHDESVSHELRAQASVYAALTRVKMMRDPRAGIAQADEGLALLDAAGADGDQARRERGWLLNVRALGAFTEGRIRDALGDEMSALACVNDGRDSSSVHLKINLISNLSVLQERTGRYDGALATWLKYLTVGDAWGPMFTKHHAYRRGGLELAAGRPDAATAAYEDAYTAAASLDDRFHRAVIALELGTLHLETDRSAALDWFDTAIDAYAELADPHGQALALTGRALATARAPGPEVAAMAAGSITYPDEAAALAARVRTGDVEGLAKALPRPRTKLNRPFDHVNLG
ncbi:hypothetical protein ACFV4N_35465 [Actinosynnema sp. NPDC059797]